MTRVLLPAADPWYRSDEAPGRKFVGPKLGGVELVKYYGEREAGGRRQAVDETLAMSRASEDPPPASCSGARVGAS